MKKEILLFLIFVLFCTLSNLTAQNIANGDMEYWNFINDGNKEFPLGWTTRNHLDNNPQANYCIRVEDSFSGDSAIMLQNFKPTTTTSLASFISIGTFNPAKPNQRGIAFYARPTSLNFAYKYFTTEVNPSGFFEAEAKITLTRWDEATNTSKVVGEAQYSIKHKTNVYLEVELPINYYKTGSPDSLYITFNTPSNPDDQVRLTLDDIHLEYASTTNVDEPVKLEKISLFPNPATAFLNILNPRFEEGVQLLIFDALGRLQVQSALLQGNQQVDIAHLDTGFYIYQVRSEEGLIQSGKFLKSVN